LENLANRGRRCCHPIDDNSSHTGNEDCVGRQFGRDSRMFRFGSVESPAVYAGNDATNPCGCTIKCAEEGG
jgi:hypothetical protein